MALLYVGTSPTNLKPLSLDPAVMTWGLQDISASDAGRVHDGTNTMYKNRTSQKRKLNLTWNYPTLAQASEILTAFNPEYFYVKYLDAMIGDWNTLEFYAGDRSAPVKWVNLPKLGTRMASLSFDIIER